MFETCGGDPAERFQYAVYDFINKYVPIIKFYILYAAISNVFIFGRYVTPEQYDSLLYVAKGVKTFLASCAVMLLVLMVFVGTNLK